MVKYGGGIEYWMKFSNWIFLLVRFHSFFIVVRNKFGKHRLELPVHYNQTYPIYNNDKIWWRPQTIATDDDDDDEKINSRKTWCNEVKNEILFIWYCCQHWIDESVHLIVKLGSFTWKRFRSNGKLDIGWILFSWMYASTPAWNDF